MSKRPLNDAWFALVESFTNHWTRKDSNTLILYFSGVAGCDPQYWPMINTFCGPTTTQGFVISEKFDRLCGKTFVTVKEPLDVLAERELANKDE